jgi:predicted nucleic acid-binding protein
VTIVVDASALVEMLLSTDRGRSARRLVGDDAMVAPDLVNVEVLGALRRLVATDAITVDAAAQAVARLRAAPIRRVGTSTLVDAVWALRANLTAPDATYVALADRLGAALLTADRRLAGAPLPAVPVIVL